MSGRLEENRGGGETYRDCVRKILGKAVLWRPLERETGLVGTVGKGDLWKGFGRETGIMEVVRKGEV